MSRPIENKTARAQEVASNYMEHAILEQGMNTSILTDNGTEFRNAKMKEFEIMRLLPVLETEHQYTPAYHPWPRGNRWLGETLRTIMNTKGLEKKEWPKLVKYLEFVYRMTPIPGTNICPFEAARGRKPKLPSNICFGTSESASAYKSLDDTAAEAVEYLNLATVPDATCQASRSADRLDRLLDRKPRGQAVRGPVGPVV